jgi:hypothetical protein
MEHFVRRRLRSCKAWSGLAVRATAAPGVGVGGAASAGGRSQVALRVVLNFRETPATSPTKPLSSKQPSTAPQDCIVSNIGDDAYVPRDLARQVEEALAEPLAELRAEAPPTTTRFAAAFTEMEGQQEVAIRAVPASCRDAARELFSGIDDIGIARVVIDAAAGTNALWRAESDAAAIELDPASELARREAAKMQRESLLDPTTIQVASRAERIERVRKEAFTIRRLVDQYLSLMKERPSEG